jgi:uroporphyrinogen decarboxylase
MQGVSPDAEVRDKRTDVNAKQRVRKVLAGELPDRTPVCLINFIVACREAGLSIAECFTSGEKIARAHVRAQKKYGHDMVHLQNGVVGMAQSFGCTVRYYDTICPEVVERPYSDYQQFLESYRGFRPGELLQSLVEATRIVSAEIGDSVYIRADSEIGPFGAAGTIFGFEKFLLDLTDESKQPQIKAVLSILSDAIVELGRLQMKAGADMTGIGDPLAGPDVISPRMYREICFPYHQRIVADFHRMGIDSYIHCCGDATGIIDPLVQTGIDAVELDYKINGRKCRESTLGECTLIGNIDPSGVLCHGTPELVREKAREAIETLGQRGWFILGPGCDLPYETPEENIYALVESARTGTKAAGPPRN